jgi:hypothetical protein
VYPLGMSVVVFPSFNISAQPSQYENKGRISALIKSQRMQNRPVRRMPDTSTGKSKRGCSAVKLGRVQ